MTKTRLKTLSRRSISTILAILMVFSCLMVGTISASATSSFTVYCVPKKIWSNYTSSDTIKIRTKPDSSGWNLTTATMTKVSGKTYDGEDIYKGTGYKDGGINNLEFSRDNGSNWTGYSGWDTNTGTYEGKMFIGNSTWVDYTTDTTTYLYVKSGIQKSSNTLNYAYVYKDGDNKLADWPGENITSDSDWTSETIGGVTFYKRTITKPWSSFYVILNNNNGTQSGDMSSSKATGKTWYVIGLSSDIADLTDTTYTITYNKGSNGSGNSIASGKKVKGVNYTLSSSTYTRTGYTQTAWNTNSSGTGGTSYSIGGSYSSNSDLSIYPTWTAKQSALTFDYTTNGGSGTAPTGKKATYDSAMPSIASNLPNARAGYTLLGMFDAQSGGTKYYNADGSSAKIWNKNTTDGTTLYAQWSLNSYNVKKTEHGGTGSVTFGSTTLTTSNQQINYGTNYTINVTAPTGFNISAITGATGFSGIGTGTATLTGYTLNADLDLDITYVSATQPGVIITANYDNSSNKANIGTSVTVTAEKTHANSGSGAMSISVTREGSAATANTDYTVTSSTSGDVTTYTIVPLNSGVFVVTASYTDTGNPSNSVTFGVESPTITVSDQDMTIGQNLNVSPSSLSNPSSLVSGWTVTYSSGNTSKVSVSGSTLSAKATGTATITAYFKYNNSTKAQTTFTVTVDKSDLAITNNDPSAGRSYFLTGDHNDILPVTSTPTITSKTWQSSNTSVFTVASDGTITAVAAGNATLTVTATFANGGVDTATASIYVQNPTLSVDKNSLSLDYISDTTNTGSDYKNTDTFTVTTNANNTAYADHTDITVTSSDTSVVTVNKSSITGTSSSDRTVTATSHAVGTATITVKYILHGSELTSLRKTINITVSEYDTEVAVYLNASTSYNRNGTSDSTIYFIPGTSSSTGSGGVAMTKIGQTNSTHNVWAIKITKKQYYNTNGFYFGTDTSIKSENNRNTTKITGSNPIKNYFVTSDTGSNGVWHGTTVSSSSTIAITKPVISTKTDETVGHLKTKSATAPTISNGVTPSSYVWTSATTAVASISGTGATPSITGNAVGTSNATVRAFIPLANTNITFSSLETSTAAAYDFIASDEQSFTITVEEVYYTITVLAYSKATSGASYSSNPAAMASYTVKDNGTVSNTYKVAAGHTATVTATPASTGYKLQGYNSDSSGSGTSYSNGQISNVQEDKTVYVLFHQKYTISYTYQYSGYLSNSPAPAATNIVFAGVKPTNNKVLQIKAGFYLDWANSTNLSKYYNEPSTKTGDVSLTSKTAANIDAGDKVDTTVTVVIAAYPTVNVTYYVDTHRTDGTAPQIKFCQSTGSDLNKANGTSSTTYGFETLVQQSSGTVYSKTIATPYYNNDNVYAKVTVNGTTKQVDLGTTMITNNAHEVWLDVVNKDKITVTKTNTQPSVTNSYPAVASGYKRIYLKQASDMGNNWSNTCIYYWNDDIDNLAPAWGEAPAMTKLGTDDEDNTYYRADIPDGAAEILFKGSNNEQSADVPLNNNNYFELTKNSSNNKNHNVEALDKMIIPTVTSAPTTVNSPLYEEDGSTMSTFSVKPATYSGSSISYSSDDEDVVTVESNGVATAQGDGTAHITVQVKSVVGDAITTINSTNYEYFEYSVTVNIVDSSLIDSVKVMSYESDTSYYYIENYSTPASTHATITNIATALTLGTASSSRDYTAAGIVTPTNTRSSDVIGYSVKYAKLSNTTDYTAINLNATLTTKADSYSNNTQRYGFKEWHDNTTPTAVTYNEAHSSYKTYKNGNNVLVDMTLPLNGKTFTAVYELYKFVDAQINYKYYEYNTIRYAGTDNEVEKNYYDADWACDPETPSTTDPKTYYQNTAGFQASHTLKTYATANIEYRSSKPHSNSDLNNKDLRNLFSSNNASAQARAMIDLNIKNFGSDYYNYSPYYSGIEYSYDSTTYVATINIYLYGTPRTYNVTLNGVSQGTYQYQAFANLSAPNGANVNWKVGNTVVATGTSYRFRVTGNTTLTTTPAGNTNLAGKTVVQHASENLEAPDTPGATTQKLVQKFYIQDFFNKEFYKYNDPNEKDTNNNPLEKTYDELTFVGGGVAYYSYNSSTNKITNQSLVDKSYVDAANLAAVTHTITRNDLYDTTNSVWGVSGNATNIGDRIQELIERNNPNGQTDEAEKLADAYATEMSLRQDTDDDTGDKTGLIYRYLPYNQKFTKATNGDIEELEDPIENSGIFRYSHAQNAYLLNFKAYMDNKPSNANRMMRVYSFMVFSYRDYTFTDNPDGEVKYVLVLSDNYTDAPTYKLDLAS